MIRYDREEGGSALADVRAEQGLPSLYEQREEQVIVSLLHALHRFGLPGWRMEATFRDLCDAMDVPGQLLALPTSLTFGFGEGQHQRTLLMRVEPSAIDLGRLAELDELTTDVVSGRLGLDEVRAALDAILQAPRRWPWAADLLAGALASGSAAALFPGASVQDMGVSAIAGTVVAALAVGSERATWLSQSWVVIAAWTSTLLAGWAASEVPEVHAGVAGVAGIILLVPGLSFTITMIELSTRNLLSAVARFAAVVLTLVQLGLGVAMAQPLLPDLLESPATTLPPWALPAALLVLPPAIGELMGARRKDLAVILLTSLAGWAAAWAGTKGLGPVGGATVGTLALGLASNAYARATERPALIPMVTGLFLLVPGSLGFRGMESLLAGHTLQGVETLFRMGMGAFALAAGLVFATSLLPPRRPR